jgi:hypothetical protein
MAMLRSVEYGVFFAYHNLKLKIAIRKCLVLGSLRIASRFVVKTMVALDNPLIRGASSFNRAESSHLPIEEMELFGTLEDRDRCRIRQQRYHGVRTLYTMVGIDTQTCLMTLCIFPNP